MSDSASSASEQAAPQITPEHLLSGLRQTSLLKCILWSLAFHVVVIGATSVGFIAAGFRSPEEVAAEQEAAKKAAEIEAAKKGEDGKPLPAAAGNAQPAPDGKTPETTAGNAQPKTTEGDGKPPRELSPIEKAISEKPKPEDIQREPDKNINLKFEDSL
jgi:hypothetical protein